MNLEKIIIKGYKSIEEIVLKQPGRFTVFVGPNASGKSNIFEALEFLALCDIMNPNEAIKLFGTPDDIFNQLYETKKIDVEVSLSSDTKIPFTHPYTAPYIDLVLSIIDKPPVFVSYIIRDTVLVPGEPVRENKDYKTFTNFTRLFVKDKSFPTKTIEAKSSNDLAPFYWVDKKPYIYRIDDSKLSTDASNLEKVLKRILIDENKKQEIFETLHLLIPGFESIEIKSGEAGEPDKLLLKEKNLKKPISKKLISDGTYNILAIIAAIYQSDSPQFLCIEEPENGINPFVVKELANIIRDICEEKGHYIWLNTHSQSLVSVLTTEEIILVEKKEGLTKIKQIQGMNLHGLRMDDALYTNSIGGGNPW
jgi:predicted ATPase